MGADRSVVSAIFTSYNVRLKWVISECEMWHRIKFDAQMHFIGHLFSQTQPNINSAQIPFLLLLCFGWKKVTLFYRQSIENSAPIWVFSLSQYIKYCIIKSMRYNNSRIIDLKAIQRLRREPRMQNR